MPNLAKETDNVDASGDSKKEEDEVEFQRVEEDDVPKSKPATVPRQRQAPKTNLKRPLHQPQAAKLKRTQSQRQ